MRSWTSKSAFSRLIDELVTCRERCAVPSREMRFLSCSPAKIAT